LLMVFSCLVDSFLSSKMKKTQPMHY